MLTIWQGIYDSLFYYHLSMKKTIFTRTMPVALHTEISVSTVHFLPQLTIIPAAIDWQMYFLFPFFSPLVIFPSSHHSIIIF